MTDRIKGLVVTLDKDYRDDDVQAIVDAVKMVRGVSDVEMSVTDPSDHMNRARILRDVQAKLHDFAGSLSSIG